MGLQSRGGIPTIEWDRITRATDPKLRGPVPAMNTPVQNANFVVNKATLTLNRAGSHPGNPILAGLGVRNGHQVGRGSRLTALFLYQDHLALGTNLVAQAASGGPGIFYYNFLAGSGQSVAGSPAAGAIRNFLRWQEPFGASEKEFWVKTKDADIVALGGLPALDPATLLAVERTAQIVDAGRTWLDVPIDFFLSWNDEFLELHRQIQSSPEVGFLKAYGGADFVTFFDTAPGTEGIGVKVNAVIDAAIKDQHVIQVENTVGLKAITVRFRSKAGSTYFVDVPILIRVLAAASGSCEPPVDEPCGQMLVKKDAPLPIHLPSAASVPGVQAVAGTPGNPVDRDLFYASIHASIVGAEANLLVRKYKLIPSPTDVAGARYEKVGGDLEFKPLRTAAASPVPGGAYQAPQQLTIAFDYAAEKALLIALYVISVKDGHTYSPGQPFTAPKSRDISFYAAGETGGNDACITYP